jgi:hypothetical protein
LTGFASASHLHLAGLDFVPPIIDPWNPDGKNLFAEGSKNLDSLRTCRQRTLRQMDERQLDISGHDAITALASGISDFWPMSNSADRRMLDTDKQFCEISCIE